MSATQPHPAIRRALRLMLLLAAAAHAPAQAPVATTASVASTSPALLISDALAAIDTAVFANKLRLDRAFFSPCLVDDDPSDPRYRRAVRAFQESRGLAPDGFAGPITSESLGRVPPLLKAVVLEQSQFDELAAVPTDWVGISRVPRWAYGSILESLAERYHTSQSFLRRLNPGVEWDRLTSGSLVVVPRITRPWPDFQVTRAVIDAREKTIRVYDADDRLRAFFNCSIGSNKQVYSGLTLRIVGAAEWPNYTFRPELFHQEHVVKGALMLPPGPNNLVGRAWTSLSRAGYGIHGTPEPELIGQTESHGCVRLPNWDALAFMRMARVGATIEFVGAPPSPDAPTTATPAIATPVTSPAL